MTEATTESTQPQGPGDSSRGHTTPRNNSPSRRKTAFRSIGLLLAALAMVVLVAQTKDDTDSQTTPTASQTEATLSTEQSQETQPSQADTAGSQAETDNETAYEPLSDLPPIQLVDLPGEALDTISLIDSGGPYPFRNDDGVFQNREAILPDQYRGYYHEYTVITPGESDRGARRIVSGELGELFYTHDHYSSFSEIAR